MDGIRPCPYCNGEIEMKQLDNDPYDNHEVFSIRCKKCGAYVVKGQGFAGELKAEANERILQFKNSTR
jgi:uncharacterized protein with PIN domain